MLIRFSMVSFASLLACSALLAADEPATNVGSEKPATKATSDAKSFADELDAINDSVTEDNKQLQAARMQMYKVQSEVSKKQEETKKKLVELINTNANDPVVMDGVVMFVEKLRGSVDSAMLEKISTALMTSSKAGDLCLKMTRPTAEPKDQENFLKQVAENHQKEEARGLAYFALGSMYRILAQGEKDEAKKAQYLIDAEKCLVKVQAEFPSVAAVAYNKSTIGEKTANELNRIRNLPNLVIGKIAPEIEGVDMDGRPFKLSDSRGKVTVLVFWGSWCGPCMAMVPHEKELVERMHGKPFEIVSVNCGDAKEKAQMTRKDKGMTWRCMWDGGTNDGPIQASYNVPHYPYIIVLDAKGVIRYIFINQDGPSALDKEIEKVMADMDSQKLSQR